MEVPASRSRRMVPGPESNNKRELPICIRTEHELRFSDGTHVPEPKMVTFMPDLFRAIFFRLVMIEITFFVNCKGQKKVTGVN
jgi:hypothetical protein